MVAYSGLKCIYYYCEETISEGIKFQRIPSPAKGFKNVTENCSENSVPSNNVTIANRYCYPNGTWGRLQNDNFKCFCVEGYGPNKTDGSCLSTSFTQIYVFLVNYRCLLHNYK